jgi:hypothetical protein
MRRDTTPFDRLFERQKAKPLRVIFGPTSVQEASDEGLRHLERVAEFDFLDCFFLPNSDNTRVKSPERVAVLKKQEPNYVLTWLRGVSLSARPDDVSREMGNPDLRGLRLVLRPPN